MSEHEKFLEDLRFGTIAAKRQALSKLEGMNRGIVEFLLPFVLSAEDQHLEWILEGYDYERGEGQKNNFRLLEDAIQDDFWYVPALTHLLIKFQEASLSKLTLLLTHEKPMIRAWSAFVLGEIGDKQVIPSLLHRLHSDNHDELWRVCEALGKLRSVEAVERLIELLQDEKANVDSVAATALGQIQDLRGLMPIIRQFKRHTPSVYAMSAALYHFGEHAVMPLIEVLWDTEAKRVHDLALMELGFLNDHRAIEPVMKYLDAIQDIELKRSAIITLGRLKAVQATEQIGSLFNTATDDFDVRHSSAMALANIGSSKAFEVLVHELKYGTSEHQHEAALAFGQMEIIFDIEPLLTALKESSPGIRSAIAVSLGNLRDKRAIPVLKEALDDADETTRKYAHLALDKISATE